MSLHRQRQLPFQVTTEATGQETNNRGEKSGRQLCFRVDFYARGERSTRGTRIKREETNRGIEITARYGRREVDRGKRLIEKEVDRERGSKTCEADAVRRR